MYDGSVEVQRNIENEEDVHEDVNHEREFPRARVDGVPDTVRHSDGDIEDQHHLQDVPENASFARLADDPVVPHVLAFIANIFVGECCVLRLWLQLNLARRGSFTVSYRD